ncbi:MAG: rhodanese-like domain-containing protein [Deltaproteobacteria bacterium]|nr:rhodanese-like domain-containing protein [Deltaproteobacteria bacterium]
MSYRRALIGLIILIIFICTWDLFWWILGVKPLLPWHLKGRLKSNAEGFSLIDVRTHGEYELFHISGAKHRPELILHPESFKANDSMGPLVVICMTGHRSAVVAYQLKKRVPQQVYSLTWGMLGWLLSGGKISRTTSN